MKSYLIGRGTVGISLMSRLSSSFLVDSSRKFSLDERVTLNGNTLSSKTVLFDEGIEKADLIILAVKNYDLDSTLPLIKGAIKERGVILSLLNGIDAYPKLCSFFGKERVVGGFVSGLSAVRDNNDVVEFNPPTLVFGNETEEIDSKIKELEDYFISHNINVILSQNIKHDRYLKFMTNVCFNTLTAVLGFDYTSTYDNQDLMRACRVISKEVRLVSHEEGVELTASDVDDMIRKSSIFSGSGKSSMLEDIEKRKRTENEYFCGKVSSLGKKYSIPTPICDFLYILLEAKRNAE